MELREVFHSFLLLLRRGDAANPAATPRRITRRRRGAIGRRHLPGDHGGKLRDDAGTRKAGGARLASPRPLWWNGSAANGPPSGGGRVHDHGWWRNPLSARPAPARGVWHRNRSRLLLAEDQLCCLGAFLDGRRRFPKLIRPIHAGQRHAAFAGLPAGEGKMHRPILSLHRDEVLTLLIARHRRQKPIRRE